MSGAFDLALSIDNIRDGDRYEIVAEADECATIADRLGLQSLQSLQADAILKRDGAIVLATGYVRANISQSCIASGEPVPAHIDETFSVEFRPAPSSSPDEEVELGADELDVIFHDGRQIELGKALLDTLALALDPFPRSRNAEAILRDAGVKGEEEAGAFGALAALKDKMKKSD